MRSLMLLLALSLLADLYAVDPYSWQVNQINAAGNSNVTTYQTPVPGGLNWCLYFDGATSAIKPLKFGSNLSITSDTLNVASGPSFTAASPSRSFNTPWQMTSNLIDAHYSVKISTSLTLIGGSEGEVHVEQADDSGFTTNVIPLGTVSNGQTGTLVVGVTLGQPFGAVLSTGYVPSGKYLRLRTNNVTGTPTYTLVRVRETTF